TGAKNFNEAIRFSMMFREQFPNDVRVASILFDAAKIYQDQLKDYRQAISLYEQIQRDAPTSPLVDDALLNEAEALRQSGSLEQAVQLYESLEKRFPASELIERARDAVEAIRLFELKNKDGGMEKLALLIGDVIAQESKGDLAFRLAEIYYHELKDYERAAAQYAQALQLRITSVKRPTALYYQAKSYENLSLKRRLAIGAETGNLAAQAIAIYDSLLTRFPLSEFFDDAVIAQFKLKLQAASSVADLRKNEEDFQKNYSAAKRKDVALLALGKAYQGLKSYDDAATTFRAFLKQYPASNLVPDVMYQLGQSLVAMGEKDTAFIVLQNYYSKFPNHSLNAKAAWELARYYGEKGNTAQAIALYQAIEQSYFYTGFNNNLDMSRGDAYFRAGDFTSAIKSYQEFVSSVQKESGNDSAIPREVIFNLALSYEKAENKSEAKKYYAAYLLRDPLSERAGQAYYALAKTASSENNLTLASKYFQQASQFSLGSPDQLNPALLESAELYFRNEDFTNAIARYNEAAKQSKGDSLQQYLQARIIVSYFRLNNTKEADSRAAVFIKSFPNQPGYAAEFEYERGMYFLRRNDLVNAKKYFNSVIEEYGETPSVPPALYGNARIAELGDKPQEAIQLYQSVLQQYPNDKIAPRVQLSLGNAYYAQEQWDPAARQFK
ncbi:MAG: tetratricopeptide repeat protein, partial [Ignavibacteriales bacterium]|nr:tetratricopeptide repeat protein [Ignavibacteriales bacterium]